MKVRKKLFKLKGVVKEYDWGGFSFISDLLEKDITNKPSAEYWLGTHPLGQSILLDVDGNEITLEAAINNNPYELIGEKVFHEFGGLPYLLKILDVNKMLSIQVHPSKQAAEKGFQKEEAAGIPISAPSRNYKDKNHKPEVMIALSEFWLLHGFKQPGDIELVLQNIPEFTIFLPLYKKEGLKALYRFFMEMPQSNVNSVLEPVVKRALRQKNDGLVSKNEPEWWIAKMFDSLSNRPEDIDRGIFSIYLMNIVHLNSGEAIFQAPGILHAYLEGQNVELMANSDNVLRGGLTTKHIDVVELLENTVFKPIIPEILKGDKFFSETIYPCPIPDFGISCIQLKEGEEYSNNANSFEIIIVTQGALITNMPDNIVVKRGEALAIPTATSYTLSAAGNCTMYKAYVPV